MKMKLLVGLAVAVLAAWTCQAADYDNGHVYNVRQFRVALGSGTAPTSADMAKIRLHNGDQVLNTDDNVLYIMNATNVYTKISAAGAMTVSGTINGITLSTTTVTNVLAAGSVLPAVDGSAVTNIVNAGIVSVSAAKLTAGTVATAIDGSAVTNIVNAGIVSLAASKLTSVLKTDANTAAIVVTTNTPAFTGQFLLGTVSNQLWLAHGVTTNSWVVIK